MGFSAAGFADRMQCGAKRRGLSARKQASAHANVVRTLSKPGPESRKWLIYINKTDLFDSLPTPQD